MLGVGGEQPQAVGELQGEFEVMGGQEYRLLRLVGQLPQEEQHVDLRWVVEECRRFVKIDYGCLLCQCLRYHHLLSLAVTKRLYHALGEMCDACLGDALGHYLAVVVVQRSPEAGIWRASETNQFGNGDVLYVGLRGEHHSDEARHLLVGERLQLFPVDGDAAAEGWLEGAQGSQQGALADAVGTDEASKLAFHKCGIDAFCHHLTVVLRRISDG